MLIGHQKIEQFFDNASANGGLGHAYCLVGVDGVGKRAIVEHFASKLIKSSIERLSTHPDYYFLTRSLDEKTEKLHKDISVKQARDLRERLQNMSWSGGYQIIVIDEAELLSIEASNALLKILEEPPKKSIFFLLTTDEKVILPTIRSRCQIFYLSMVSTGEIKSGLTTMGCDDDVAETAAKLSWGRPGQAMTFWRDSASRQQYFFELKRLSQMIGVPFHTKISQVEELFGKKDDDVQLKRGRWQEVIKIWQMVWRDALLYKLSAGGGESAESDLIKYCALPEQKIVTIIDRLKQAERLMGENINPRLLIEEVIMEF